MGGEETNWVGGPIKSVKIVWSRELCSRGALPGDPGATGRPLQEVLVGRLEPLLGSFVPQSPSRRYGWIKGDQKGPSGVEVDRVGALPARLEAEATQSRCG